MQTRLEEADGIRKQSVERAQYQVDLARERFMNVDPRNRMVADQLEADWNEKLREMEQVRQRYEEQREKDRLQLDEDARQKILSLAKDFPRIWNDPTTTFKQRKRMIRLLIEDVTLTRKETNALLQIRLRGGQCKTIEVPLPLHAGLMRKTPKHIIEEIDRLLDDYTEGQIVQQFNELGITSSTGQPFSLRIIGKLRRKYNLTPRYERLRKRGFLTQEEVAKILNVTPVTIRIWYEHGMIIGYDSNNKNKRLYKLPENPEDYPQKEQGQKLTQRGNTTKVTSHATNEVHHEQ